MVAFGATDALDPLVSWQALFPASPDAFTRLPTGGGQAQGIRDGYMIVVQVQPGRVDLILQPPPSVGDAPPIIQDGASAGELALSLMNQLPLPAIIERVAVVSPSTRSVTNFKEAIEALKKVAPVSDGLSLDMLDVSFQLIRERKTEDWDGHLIYIARWNVTNRPFIKIDINNPAQPIINGSIPVLTTYVDVATKPDTLSREMAITGLAIVAREAGMLLQNHARFFCD